jgi:threonine dehydrogenase-like Zn-dependent dehydrogenase
MQQLQYLGPDEVDWRDVDEPSLPSDHAALVRPIAVATCDLDALIVRGSSPFPPPFALGHECVAEVVDAGDAVSGIEPGQRVTVPFQISCGTCDACKRGRTANCTSFGFMTTYGFGPGVAEWGGFLSDVVAVPFADHMLVPIPERLEPAAVASASDNIADGWRTVGPALEREPGAEVLVVGGAGPGSIGLYAAAVAIALGAKRVVYADTDEGRASIARGLGAETEVGEFPKRLGPFPVTVDSSADPDGLALALRSTAPDGVCTSTGIYFRDPTPMPLLEMYTKGITFETGRVHARAAIPHVLELAGSKKLRPEAVTTRVVGWDDAPAALVERGWTKLVMTRDGAAAEGSSP